MTASVRDDLNRVLTFYDEHKPEKLGTAVQVFGTADTVKGFCAKHADGTYWYRGYQIVPVDNKARQT